MKTQLNAQQKAGSLQIKSRTLFGLKFRLQTAVAAAVTMKGLPTMALISHGTSVHLIALVMGTANSMVVILQDVSVILVISATIAAACALASTMEVKSAQAMESAAQLDCALVNKVSLVDHVNWSAQVALILHAATMVNAMIMVFAYVMKSGGALRVQITVL